MQMKQDMALRMTIGKKNYSQCPSQANKREE